MCQIRSRHWLVQQLVLFSLNPATTFNEYCMAKILIIEDSLTNMKLTSFLVKIFGHIAICTTDAEIGLVLVYDELPDLILMDIQLPGMDGWTATTLLKQDVRTASIPIIAYMALASEIDHKKCIAAGCAACIAKPVNYKELTAVIARHLVIV